MSARRYPTTLLLCIVCLTLITLITLITMPFVGGEFISPIDLFQGQLAENDQTIFWKLRVPRVIMGFLAGSALALSGMAFQAVFRNPLATPFTLGVASGASLGAATYVWLGFSFKILHVSGQSFFAFLGAALTISLVYGLTQGRNRRAPATMLLAGVSISFFCSSLIMFIQYISDFNSSMRIMRWLMGGIDVVGYDSIMNTFPIVLIGTGLVWYLARDLNLLITGEEIAVSRGVNVNRTVTLLFITTSFLVGSVVAICGPIGFVGMMAPHICRMLIGQDHRYLTPATTLFGGTFLVLCDTLARSVIAPAEMPVGIITALLGGPFFLWLLLRSRIDGQV
jgi:iron complex transport system permease protein